MIYWMIPAALIILALLALGLGISNQVVSSSPEESGIVGLMMECARISDAADYRSFTDRTEQEIDSLVERGAKNKHSNLAHQLLILKALLMVAEENQHADRSTRIQRNYWIRRAALILVKLESGLYSLDDLKDDLDTLRSTADSPAMNWLGEQLSSALTSLISSSQVL